MFEFTGLNWAQDVGLEESSVGGLRLVAVVGAGFEEVDGESEDSVDSSEEGELPFLVVPSVAGVPPYDA